MSGVVGGLLARGLLAGLVAGLLAASFAAWFGEPSLERAIAFEAAVDAAAGHEETLELVGREVQKREGLFTAGAVYGAAVGGLFGLGFALAHGRVGSFGPRGTAARLAVLGFVAIALVPALKYPADPPGVGTAATIGLRTALYFTFVLVSVGAAALAALAREPLGRRFGSGGGDLAALALFVGLVTTVGLLLPAVADTPGELPGDLITAFRWAAVATQAVLWAALGTGFVLLLPQNRADAGNSRARRRFQHDR